MQRASHQQLAAQRRPSHDDLVRLEKVTFLDDDDDDDDTFQYAAVDDATLGLDDDVGDEEEDFEAVLRNLNKSTSLCDTSDPDDASHQQPSHNVNTNSSLGSSQSLPHLHTQVRPSVVDDFIRNFLIKVGMTRTLDMFNHEWYEFLSKGKLKEEENSIVPDIYMRNLVLDDQVKALRKEVEETREITEKAKTTWDKFRKQRDVHKMHHHRLLQEKEGLIHKIKKLEKQMTAYEPLLHEMKIKYEHAMKEKMLMRLERDRQVAKAEAIESQLKTMQSSGNNHSKKNNTSTAVEKKETPIKKTSGKVSSVTSSSSNSSSSSKNPDTKLPPSDSINPHVDSRFEPVNGERMEIVKTCQGHGHSIAAIAFHPRNPILASASDDQTWKLWSVPQSELIMSGEGHRSWLSSIEFHPRGTHVATSSGDNTVKLWDFVSASCSLTLSDHAHPVWESVFHHDGDFLVSASMDHTCKLWDLQTGKCRKTLRGHVDSVNSVCFQPYSMNIVTASGDKTISIWDLRSGLCVQTFYGHGNACNAVTCSLQGDTIASCDADGFIKCWDVRMVTERCTLDGGQSPLNSIAFDRSGHIVASASDDASIKLFDIKNQIKVADLKGHEGPVQSVKFEPHGRYLASSSSDCTFRLWST